MFSPENSFSSVLQDSAPDMGFGTGLGAVPVGLNGVGGVWSLQASGERLLAGLL